MPNSEHRPFGNIRPSVTAQRYHFRCRSDRACIPVQESGKQPHRDPVNRRQVAPDEIERGIDRSGEAVPSNFLKRC